MVDIKPVELQTESLTKMEHRALRALESGEADAHQQRLALEVIVKKLSRTYDLSYIPGDTHASAFLQGRGYVGSRIIRYLKTPVEDPTDGSST